MADQPPQKCFGCGKKIGDMEVVCNDCRKAAIDRQNEEEGKNDKKKK